MGKVNPVSPKRPRTGSSPGAKALSPGPSFKSVPSAADLGEVLVGKRSESSVGKDSNVHFYTMTYATDGSGYADYFSGGDLQTVHIIHQDYPSVMFQLRRNLEDFAVARHEEDAEFPSDLTALERHFFMKVVYTTGDDPDQLGVFQRNRIAVYVKGDDASLKALFSLFDDFVSWRCRKEGEEGEGRQPELKFHVPQSSLVAFSSADQMECTYEILKDDYSGVVSVFDAHPPTFPCRLVCAHIEGESKSFVSIVFSGNTWPFRGAFDEMNIGGKKVSVEGKSYPEYYRVLRNTSISEPESLTRVLSIFDSAVLKSSPTIVRVVKVPADDEVFKHFLHELHKRAHVKFLQ